MTEGIVLAKGGRRAAEQQVKDKEERASKFSSRGLYEDLRLAAPDGDELYGESIVLRMVTDEDEWQETRDHAYISTKPAPGDMPDERKKKWPAKMGAVCRHTPGFDAIYDECFICDHTTITKTYKGVEKQVKPFASARLWAVAVARTPVKGTQAHVDAGLIEPFQVGAPVWYEDEYVKKTIGDEEKLVKRFLVLHFSLTNFFDKLLGAHNVYGTVVDRDYKVTRKGKGTDTDYEIIALDPQIVQEGDLKGKRYDLRNPAIASQYELPFNLIDVIAEQASDEHYEWFFDTRVNASYEKRFGKQDAKSGSEEAASEPRATQAQNEEAQREQNTATLDAIRQRMLNK